MPLRDHFHTTSTLLSWEALYATWPMTMVAKLNSILPPEYVASPRIYTGFERSKEFDVDAPICIPRNDEGWVLSKPILLLDTELPEPSEYEVNIYTQEEFRLVAAIGLVSPSNKDRSESRKTFVNKCEGLLKKDVCVTIIDPVTTRTANLYGELLDELDVPRTTIARSLIYAVTCRGRRSGIRWRLESWEHELNIGSALPTLPLWLSPDLMVPLDLEATYEEACRSLRIR